MIGIYQSRRRYSIKSTSRERSKKPFSMGHHKPPWKHYIPLKISDNAKIKSQGDDKSLPSRKISHLDGVCFWRFRSYLTSRDLYTFRHNTVFSLFLRLINLIRYLYAPEFIAVSFQHAARTIIIELSKERQFHHKSTYVISQQTGKRSNGKKWREGEEELCTLVNYLTNGKSRKKYAVTKEKMTN